MEIDKLRRKSSYNIKKDVKSLILDSTVSSRARLHTNTMNIQKISEKNRLSARIEREQKNSFEKIILLIFILLVILIITTAIVVVILLK